jgi:hypothetical protein
MGIRKKVGLCLAVTLSLAACGRRHRNRIPKGLGDAYAGDLATATVEPLVQWLEAHPAVTMHAEGSSNSSKKSRRITILTFQGGYR